MPILNAIYCTGSVEESVNFSGQSIPIGSFITAYDGTPAPDNINYCFEITAGDEISGTLTATTETYSSCYDCLAQNYTIISIVDCLTNTISLVLDITQFGYIPIVGTVLNLIVDVPTGINLGNYSGCYEITEVMQYSEDDYNDLVVDLGFIQQIVYSNFSLTNGCNECLNGFSAGTESESCTLCWDGSGYTATVVSPPHPKWTNLQGQTTILLDAIQLGGMNGLNS
jgi:hypothetical protein